MPKVVELEQVPSVEELVHWQYWLSNTLTSTDPQTFTGTRDKIASKLAQRQSERSDSPTQMPVCPKTSAKAFSAQVGKLSQVGVALQVLLVVVTGSVLVLEAEEVAVLDAWDEEDV